MMKVPARKPMNKGPNLCTSPNVPPGWRALLFWVLVLIGNAAIAMSAAAQTVPREKLVLEEVIVVAQKRPQNLQDVPVAVTAF